MDLPKKKKKKHLKSMSITVVLTKLSDDSLELIGCGFVALLNPLFKNWKRRGFGMASSEDSVL